MYTLSEEDIALLAGVIRIIRGTRIPGGAVTQDGMVFPQAARSAGLSVAGGWAGKIVDAGPEEEADFTDERYWVERTRCKNHDEDPVDAAAEFEALDEEHELANIVAVTNLPEILDGGHALAVGTDVWVWEVWDRSDPPRARRVMMAAVAVAGFWARITGSAEIGTTGIFKYAWTEQERTAAGWQDKSGGRSGTTSVGFAITGRDFVITGSNGPIVRMYPETDSAGDPCFTFEIPVPPGTASYQGLYWVDGEWKVDFARLHA